MIPKHAAVLGLVAFLGACNVSVTSAGAGKTSTNGAPADDSNIKKGDDGAKPSGPAAYGSMTWSDEFNATQVDWNVWNSGYPWFNDPQYNPANATESGGSLHLTSKGCNDNYTKGGINTNSGKNENDGTSKFSFTFGTLEAKIKMTGNTGIWPAFWTMPQGLNNEDDGEIDILEAVTENHVLSFNTTIHKNTQPNTSKDCPLAPTDGWHTYTLDWRPNYVDVYYDGVLCRRWTGTLPQKKHYVILGNQITGTHDGDWGDVPDSTTKNILCTTGDTMDVDYVRYWQTPN